MLERRVPSKRLGVKQGHRDARHTNLKQSGVTMSQWDDLLLDGLLAAQDHLPDADVSAVSTLLVDRYEARTEADHSVIAIEDCTPVRRPARPLIHAVSAACLAVALAVALYLPSPNGPRGNTYVSVLDPAASRDQQTSDQSSPTPVGHRPVPTIRPLPLYPLPSPSTDEQTMLG